MSRRSYRGKCVLCGGTFGKSEMSRHLNGCLKENGRDLFSGGGKGREVNVIHLLIEGGDAPEYWMHVEIPSDAPLGLLDAFLRGIWLECCGHLSAFTIEGTRYSISPMAELDERAMNNVVIGRIVRVGMKFFHEYDFGSTTVLKLKAVSERTRTVHGKRIELLARNEPPAFKCECGAPATEMCTECSWESLTCLCDECAEDHECGEEMLLPVVNSPRMGVCGYTG